MSFLFKTILISTALAVCLLERVFIQLRAIFIVYSSLASVGLHTGTVWSEAVNRVCEFQRSLLDSDQSNARLTGNFQQNSSRSRLHFANVWNSFLFDLSFDCWNLRRSPTVPADFNQAASLWQHPKLIFVRSYSRRFVRFSANKFVILWIFQKSLIFFFRFWHVLLALWSVWFGLLHATRPLSTFHTSPQWLTRLFQFFAAYSSVEDFSRFCLSHWWIFGHFQVLKDFLLSRKIRYSWSLLMLLIDGCLASCFSV